jgi:sugar phosphate isomerase/epimerase
LAEFEVRERIAVCVENMPGARLLGFRLNAYRYNDLRQLAGFPHLVLDTTHLATWGLDPVAAYAQLRERVVHVHLSSYDPASDRGHGLPDKSDVPLAELLRQLARDGYPGAITLEGNPESLNAAEPVQCVASLRGAIAFCRGAMQMTGKCL